jgi:Flp pilus assembly CpaF family ATPase
MFRLGRLQPLVELPDAENIEGFGCDRLLVKFGNGSIREVDPIWESDDEMIEFFQDLAARDPNNERSFTRANWSLDLDLPGRARLAAMAWIVPRPTFTIRLQRLRNVDLSLLRENGTIDHILEHFLTSAVRARKSIVVSGEGQGSGKTTLLRALCSALDPDEKVGTIETDYELYLHEDQEHHRRVVAMRARDGSGEMMANGRRQGAVDTAQLIYPSLRHTLDRIIVGEVRGREITAMFEAMQAGNGSLSTVHADSAAEVVERLVGLAVKDSALSEEYAYRQVIQAIDLIVYLSVRTDHAGRPRRFVSKVIEVTTPEIGSRGRVSIGEVFAPRPDGRAVPIDPPTFIDDLVAAGFDRTLFAYRDGAWDEP